jgi:hypothetical protein
MKIYYGELTPEQMQQAGATYQECANCGETPLIWQQGVFDAVCESCGAWQKDVLPDGLTNREIEKWYRDKEKENAEMQTYEEALTMVLSVIDEMKLGSFDSATLEELRQRIV